MIIFLYFTYQGYYTITIDGKLIHSFTLLHLAPVTYYDVTVFSGDADASYKNLIWENLPAPEILFHVGTPAIVSLSSWWWWWVVVDILYNSYVNQY